MELKGNPVVYGVEKYKKNFELLKSFKPYLHWKNTIFGTKFLDRCEKKINFTARKRHPSEYSENSITLWKPTVANGLAFYMEDEKSLNGMAAKHIGQKSWGVQWKFHDFIDYLIPGKTYIMRISVRPEIKKERTGTMFQLMSFHHGALYKGQPAFSGKFDPMYKDGKYHWVNLGKVKFENPDSTGMYWMTPLVDTDEAVWYERLELIPIDEFKEDLSTVPDKTVYL